MTISCEIFAYGSSLPLFIFARAVQGVSSSLVNAAGLSLLATQYRDEARRDSAMGIAMCGMCIGYSAGPSAGGLLCTACTKVYWTGRWPKVLPNNIITAGIMSAYSGL